MKPSNPRDMTFMDKLQSVAEVDVAGLYKAQQEYGNSWKKRGGVGAYMMLARKWDRIEKCVSSGTSSVSVYDIFGHIMADDRPEGLIDDIRDLRRYLLLVEAEMQACEVPCAMSTHRDNYPTEGSPDDDD